MEARDKFCASPAGPPAPDHQQCAARYRPLRRCAEALRRVQARIPVRTHPWRRPPQALHLPQRNDPLLPARANRLRGAPPSAEVPRGSGRRYDRARLRPGSRRASRDKGNRQWISGWIRGGSGHRALAGPAEQGVAQGLSRWHIRCRRFVRRRGGPANRQQRWDHRPLDAGKSGASRIRRRRRASGGEWRAVRPDPRRPEGTASVLSPHRPCNYAEEDDRRRRAEVRRQDTRRFGRAARHGAAAVRHHHRHGRLHRRRCRKPQLLRSSRRTSIWTSTRGGISSARSS